MENLDIFEEEGLLENVQQNAPLFKAELDTLQRPADRRRRPRGPGTSTGSSS